MSRAFQSLIALFFIGLAISISCKKKENTTSAVITHLNELFADIKTAPQNFTVTAGKYQTVIGLDSTVINFYPNSFKDENGAIISLGNINIELLEVYKPGDMIANRTSATASGQLIQSGGQINLVATMNGKQVYANKYGIAFKQKSLSYKPMELYF